MRNRSLNILIVTAWYKSDEFPTSGSFVEEQARMLQSNGHQVTVLHPYLLGTFFKTIKSPKFITKAFNDKGIKTISIGARPVAPKLRSRSYNRLAKKSLSILQKEIALNEIDLIHCHSAFMGGVVGNYISEKSGIPFVVTEHTSGLLFNSDQYTKRDVSILKKVYGGAKIVFFVSSFAKENIARNYNLSQQDKHAVIGNVVDDLFYTVKPVTGEFSYIIIAGLKPIKNHRLLLNAWETLIQHYPKSVLTIAGEGELKNELIKLSEELSISESIRWLPQLSREDVKKEIDNYHVLVSTSQLETFGLTVAEATASGKPVVVTDSGGVRDIVNKQNGIITSFDAANVSKALIDIQANYSNYSLEDISKECYNRFSSHVIYKKLYSFYNRTLE